MMNTRTIVIGIVVLIILGVGAYFVFKPSAQPASQTPSSDQVQGQEVAVGTGEEAKPGTQVSVLYVGKLQDGTVFDSSEAHGNQPLVFTLGTTGLIPGFQIGVNGMKVGGERLIAVPPSLGYGAEEVKDASGKVVVPANSTLIFSIKLVKVEQAPTSTTTPAQ